MVSYLQSMFGKIISTFRRDIVWLSTFVMARQRCLAQSYTTKNQKESMSFRSSWIEDVIAYGFRSTEECDKYFNNIEFGVIWDAMKILENLRKTKGKTDRVFRLTRLIFCGIQFERYVRSWSIPYTRWLELVLNNTK